MLSYPTTVVAAVAIIVVVLVVILMVSQPKQLPAIMTRSETATLFHNPYIHHHSSIQSLDSSMIRNLQDVTDEAGIDDFSQCSNDSDAFYETNPSIKESQPDAIQETIRTVSGTVVAIDMVFLPDSMTAFGAICQEKGGIYANLGSTVLQCVLDAALLDTLGLMNENNNADPINNVTAEYISMKYFGNCFANTESCQQFNGGDSSWEILDNDLQFNLGLNCTAVAVDVDVDVDDYDSSAAGRMVNYIASTVVLAITVEIAMSAVL